jgi:hypothetical protein
MALRPFIECYWFLHTDGAVPAHGEEIIFTDARADLMLCSGSPYLRQNAGPRKETQLMRVSHLDAQRRYPVHIIQDGQIDLVGVRFRPASIRRATSVTRTPTISGRHTHAAHPAMVRRRSHY